MTRGIVNSMLEKKLFVQQEQDSVLEYENYEPWTICTVEPNGEHLLNHGII